MASALLDSPPEAAFDDLTRLAAMLVGAPFAFATVVDEARSFWKSSFGIPAGGPRQNRVEESFCQYVVRSRRELIVTDASIDERTRENPSIKSMGVRAWAGFPLLAPGGDVLGSFCIVDTVPREWSARDLEVIRTLADAASREIALRGAVEDQRRARARAEALAQTLQESLLPPALPAVQGLEVAARFHPAGSGIELVGDFYDLFQSGVDRWSFVIGDVCGKGIEAAKVALFARHTIGAAAMKSANPGEVIAWLNETMLARKTDSDLFLTAVYGTIAFVRGGWRVRLACAGHVPPVVRRVDGTAVSVAAGGPLVGVFPAFAVAETEVALAPGDSLIVFTDGVSDARKGQAVFGEDGVRALVAAAELDATASDLAAQIERAARSYYVAETKDDIAILVVRVPVEPRMPI